MKRLLIALALSFSSTAFAGCNVEPYCISCPDPNGEPDASVAFDAPNDANQRDTPFIPPDAQTCVPLGEDELCNLADDNCNGVVDEGFDFTTNPLHCGGCGQACRFPNSEATCVDSDCVLGECLPGFIDNDTDPGCEYRCPIFPTMTEQCNGIDDDCDGLIDEPEDLPAPPSDLCRSTPGTPCAGVTPTCTARAGVTTWFCNYGAGVEFDPIVPNGIVLEETRCDGQDGDCDGLRDEAFADLNGTCDNSARGACRDGGVVRCDPADVTQTVCDLSVAPNPAVGAPSAELCNGVDDNCDGTVDNSDPSDPARIRDDMVHVVRGGRDFWIYRQEASRPDATMTALGASAARSCSSPNVRPWTGVGFADATAACTAAGLRLCTGAEWQSACAGASTTTYPYGAMYSATMCNGADRVAMSVVLPTASVAMCRSTEGALDMSGNVKEWTNDARGTSGSGRTIYVVRGGSFDSPELGLTCGTDLSRATSDTILPTLGFRCCSNTAP